MVMLRSNILNTLMPANTAKDVRLFESAQRKLTPELARCYFINICNTLGPEEIPLWIR